MMPGGAVVGDLVALKNELQEKRRRTEDCNRKKADAERRVAIAGRIASERRLEHVRLKERLEALDKELAGASQRKETLESAAAARAEEHAARQRQLSAAEEEIKASLGRIEASCLQQARAQAALNQAFGAATARCKAALKAGAKDCMSRYKALLERRKELEQRIASQKAEVGRLRGEAAGLAKEAEAEESVKARCEDMRAQITACERRVGELRAHMAVVERDLTYVGTLPEADTACVSDHGEEERKANHSDSGSDAASAGEPGFARLKC